MKYYIVPDVEIISVVVEKGYGASESENGDDGGMSTPGWGTI